MADVIVIGGGLAGCCAALGALEAGASVLLLEKLESGMGSTWQSAGTFAFGGTDMQRAAGIEDSPAQLAEELMRVGGGKNEPALIARFAELELGTYAWLKAQGVVFERVQISGGQGAARSHATSPAQAMAALEGRLAGDSRFTRLDNTAALRLMRRDGGWTVCTSDRDHAARAVIVASGGFSRSREFIELFAPELHNGVPLGGMANTGDGLRMAMAVGCGLADMAYVKGTFGMPLANWPQPTLTAPNDFFLLMAIYRGAIAVNRDAVRFTDESRSYKEIGGACLAQPDGVAFQIFDSKVMAQSQQVPSNMDFAGALERGIIRRGGTIAELAGKLGLDANALEATVSRYNGAVAAGRDGDFGRTSIAGGVGVLTPLDEPDFYGFPCGVAVTSTLCGIRVDPDARVLDPFGEPISGLYAAGEVAGGFHGESYMSGSALAKAAVFGRIAGQNAAADRV